MACIAQHQPCTPTAVLFTTIITVCKQRLPNQLHGSSLNGRLAKQSTKAGMSSYQDHDHLSLECDIEHDMLKVGVLHHQIGVD